MNIKKGLSGIFCRVYVKIKSILSMIFHAIYGAVRFGLLPVFCDDCGNMCNNDDTR